MAYTPYLNPIFAPLEQHWYAQQRTGVYHASADDYVQTGKARCGRGIRNPSWFVVERPTTGAFKRCKGCAKHVTPVAAVIEVR